ncbi:signal peptide peptidase-like 2B [Rhipicephalus sanguineus]|uniref:signal peptide peptidase-like 2B n=1 Tax=Rhipicephalus sanguineus TaxID=34632 RepID=UPI0020C54577|nr:signal peptide peptidase-like 2B [Rhipicephalus sanguineus]
MGQEKSSGKHVILMLPEDENPCPFETSFSQALSAHAYSLVVARNFDLKPHLAYFTPESDVLVPRQDIILAEMQLKTVEKFKPKNMSEWSAAAANGSVLMGPAAKLYLVYVNMTPSWIVLCVLACSTVAVGALWAGSTRKLLFLTLHRRIKPKEEQPLNEDADLDVVPAALTVPSNTSLGLATTISVATSEHKRKHQKRQQHQQQQQYDVVRSRSRHGHQPKPFDDFPSSDDEALNEESYFGECPLGCNLVTLFVLAIAVNLLVLYYFFSKIWPIMVGCIAIGSMMSLVIIFDCIAFLIPCASTRMTNFMFPCFVRSMELRHHIVIWLAVCIPIVWIVFRKSEHAWILQDFLGSSFAINILRCVHFPNFKASINGHAIITLISVLLFFDDIFMVFVTSLLTKDVSVMESVAMGVQDLPVLMRVPHFFPGESAVCPGNAMFLGYGDIAVPGLAVAYCRSYDVIVKKGMPWYFLLAIVCKLCLVIVQT